MGMPQGSGNHILNVLIPTQVQGDPEVGVGTTIDRCIMQIQHNNISTLYQLGTRYMNIERMLIWPRAVQEL